MTATFNEEHYRRIWNEMLQPVIGDDYMNLEGDLDREMKVYQEAFAETEMPEADRENFLAKIRREKAKEIAERATPKLKETMAMIKRIKAGKASLGYTTWSAERSNMFKLVERFEFNCLQLADLKKKYEL